jgi:hypothetical protein
MNPTLRMILARERVADLIEIAQRGRPRVARRRRRPRGTAPFSRLRDGSWIYRRRDSS